jgi:proliferating cell nuclear antigen PCNA
MKITFDRIARFVAPLHALKDLNDSLQIVFGRTSCRAVVMDTAHVSVSFVSWVSMCDGGVDRDVVVSIRLSNLLTALQLARDSADAFSLELESIESDTMILVMDEGDTTVHLRLMESDTEMMDTPPFENATECVFDTSRFRDVCRELSLLGDTVTFQCDGTNLILHASGDIGNAKITLRPISVVNPAVVGPLGISLRYMNSVLKAYTVSSRVIVSFLDSYPVKVQLSSDDVAMESYIAPKIPDEP